MSLNTPEILRWEDGDYGSTFQQIFSLIQLGSRNWASNSDPDRSIARLKSIFEQAHRKIVTEEDGPIVQLVFRQAIQLYDHGYGIIPLELLQHIYTHLSCAFLQDQPKLWDTWNHCLAQEIDLPSIYTRWVEILKEDGQYDVIHRIAALPGGNSEALIALLEQDETKHQQLLRTYFPSAKTKPFNGTKDVPWLPVDVLSTIFIELGPKEVLQCAQVNRAWRNVASTERVWIPIYKRYFSQHVVRTIVIFRRDGISYKRRELSWKHCREEIRLAMLESHQKQQQSRLIQGLIALAGTSQKLTKQILTDPKVRDRLRHHLADATDPLLDAIASQRNPSIRKELNRVLRMGITGTRGQFAISCLSHPLANRMLRDLYNEKPVILMDDIHMDVFKTSTHLYAVKEVLYRGAMDWIMDKMDVKEWATQNDEHLLIWPALLLDETWKQAFLPMDPLPVSEPEPSLLSKCSITLRGEMVLVLRLGEDPLGEKLVSMSHQAIMRAK
eukprot:TRINITY_DN5051_c0_g1_i2.p1 TRINITY_DN5051_c0_g1~~TRINITY_DN5051_c0_g1_i2.p1  ORF type:complete len:498 (+),score=72.63 TRINITY_DN5051_c0_g1_i2:55-1548(+)